MTASVATPEGSFHEVAVDDVFFSTTDRSGVIELSNAVFSKISGYAPEQLTGAPHNLVRHPQMPAGAFRVMWDALLAGRPFAGYVRNRSFHGGFYDVFATVTPLPGGGFLSVRTRPMQLDLFSTIFGAYGAAQEVETRERAGGANARDAAAAGAAVLEQAAQSLGFSDYETLQNLLLPTELAAREEASAGLPQRPQAVGDLAEALDATRQLHVALDEWMRHQNVLLELSSSLRRAGSRLVQETAEVPVDEEGLAVLAASGGFTSSLVEPLRVWLQMQTIVHSSTDRLVAALHELDRTTGRMRFLVALSRLQATALAGFAAEMIDAETDPLQAAIGGQEHSRTDATAAHPGAAAIRMLLAALRQGLTEMNAHAREHRSLAQETASQIGKVASILQIPRELLQLWTAQVTTEELSSEASTLAPRISQQITRAGSTLDLLTDLAEQCRAGSITGDEEELRTLLARIESAIARSFPHRPNS